MKEMQGKSPYATWHKAVLIGCLVIAVLGTLGVIGGMVKISGTVTEFGGTVGAPLFLAFIMALLSMWLFAGSGALLVYIAKMSGDIASTVQPAAPEKKED